MELPLCHSREACPRPDRGAGIHGTMKNYYVYILASKHNGTLYIGVTSNLARRVYEHKNNLIDGFTKKTMYTR